MRPAVNVYEINTLSHDVEGFSYRSIDDKRRSDIRFEVRLYAGADLQVKQRRKRSRWWIETSSRVNSWITGSHEA